MKMENRSWIAITLFLSGLLATAHSQTFVRKPFLQKGSPNKASVCWRVEPAAALTVKYGTTAANLDKTSAASANAKDACVSLDGLVPETKYFYEVYAGAVKLTGSADQYLVTHPAVGAKKKYAFWIIGDAGTGTAQQAQVRDGFVKAHGGNHADGFIMLGDNAYATGTDAEFTDKLFEVYPNTMANTFTWPTVGNHEAMTSGASPYLAAFYLPTAAEAGGIASQSELYYSFDYGNVHFICLDSELGSRTKTGAQYLWLQQDLQATRQDWIVVYFHHPPYTWGSHNSDTESKHVDMRQNFLPLMEQYGVDLVYGGHSHDYERSFLLDSAYGNSTDNKAKAAQVILDKKSGDPAGTGSYRKASMKGAHEGAVYTVAGSSGQVSSIIGLHPVMFAQRELLGSVILTVEDTVATAKFIDNTGAMKDQFQIIKSRPTTDIAGNSGKPTTRFTRSGRQFRFPGDNTVPFRIYSLNGDLLLRKTLRGPWSPEASMLPQGEYFYRYGASFGRMTLP
jgi:hypothetical protein